MLVRGRVLPRQQWTLILFLVLPWLALPPQPATAQDQHKMLAADVVVPQYTALDALRGRAPNDGKVPDGPFMAPQRKLQLNGLGLKYQVNERLAVEGGLRLGLLPGAGIGASGSSGAFIRLQRSFNAK